MGDKVIEVQTRVPDLAGLFFDLQKSEFSVRNVGGDAVKTYVYLEQSEEKDPTPVVTAWADKPAPTRTEMSARAIRWKAELEAFRARKEEEARKAEAAEAARIAAADEAMLVDEPEEEEKPSLIRRIFRKLW